MTESEAYDYSCGEFEERREFTLASCHRCESLCEPFELVALYVGQPPLHCKRCAHELKKEQDCVERGLTL